jgi:FKBP-type peptidyl-prolyl cis-trans isomerase
MKIILQRSKLITNNCLLTLFAVTILLASCKNSGKHPGYTEAEPGIYYKLHIPGESGKKAGPDDFYEVRMQNKYNGKVFFDSEFQNARGTMLMQSSASRYFSVLAEGDSATFLLPGGDLSLPGMPDTGMVEMNVKVLRIVTADEAAKMEKPADPELEEQVFIHRYMTKNKLNIIPDSNGLYFQSIVEGQGAKPEKGKYVSIKYKGIFPNGQEFESSSKPFTFQWGEEGQVIPGFVYALRKMRAGGKARIILPSQLAFGTEGSSDGMVPAHTPLVYELEVLTIDSIPAPEIPVK